MLESLRVKPENRYPVQVALIGCSVALFVLAKFLVPPEIFEAAYIQTIVVWVAILFVISSLLCAPTAEEVDWSRRNGWGKAVKMVSPSLKYDHDKKFDPKKLRSVYGLQRVVTHLESTGELSTAQYHFHFIKAENRAGKNSSIVFEGVVSSITCDRERSGITLISPDLLEALTGFDLPRLGSPHNFPNEALESIRLENQKFERFFRVQTSNAIEARTILTPLAMEGLIQFKDKFLALPKIAVFDNTAAVLVPGSMPRESIKLDGQLKDIDGYISSLKTACEMLDSLKNIIK